MQFVLHHPVHEWQGSGTAVHRTPLYSNIASRERACSCVACLCNASGLYSVALFKQAMLVVAVHAPLRCHCEFEE
jgi:hypothetical protein